MAPIIAGVFTSPYHHSMIHPYPYMIHTCKLRWWRPRDASELLLRLTCRPAVVSSPAARLPVAGAARPAGFQFALHSLVARSVGLRRCEASSARRWSSLHGGLVSGLHLLSLVCICALITACTQYVWRLETSLLESSFLYFCNNNIQRVHQTVTAGERERFDFDACIDRSETGRPVVQEAI
jgi:hypothetical protein